MKQPILPLALEKSDAVLGVALSDTMWDYFAEKAQEALLSFDLALIYAVDELVLVLKTILEFDVGVLVNVARIFMDGSDCELPEFGVDALNDGQHVRWERLVKTVLYWLVDFTDLELLDLKFLGLIDQHLISSQLLDRLQAILLGDDNVNALGQNRSNASIFFRPVKVESNAALR